MNQQTHLIFGTGLIGGYLGGVLISQGINTTFLGREKSKAAMAEGLTVADYQGHCAELVAPNFDHGDKQFDVIWVAVKCGAVADIVKQLGLLLKPTTCIICCQNGLGSDQALRESFPEQTILNAIVVFNVAEISTNHLYKSTEGELVMESSPVTRGFFEQIHCDLLPSRLSEDINAEKWAKLQLNLGNAVNALADVPILEMLQTRGYRKIIASLMTELLEVTDALGINLPKMSAVPAHWLPKTMNTPNWLYQILANKVIQIDPKARMSMWWDLSAGRVTEIDYLNAAVVRHGQELGIDCPVNRKLVKLIKSAERGERKIGLSAEQMQAQLH